MTRKQEQIIGFFIGVITLVWYYSLCTSVHHGQNKLHCYGIVVKASFDEFKWAFQKKKWQYDPLFEFLTSGNRDYIGDGIIMINGVGFNLTSYGLIRANRFIKRYKEDAVRSYANGFA